jgi:hypothetical protein
VWQSKNLTKKLFTIGVSLQAAHSFSDLRLILARDRIAAPALSIAA